ncbi:MAG: hypothetical protein U9N49_10135 [Campylobacterota bacterium]|nr:hypothetical protein [Campylobacterota bacterium]
MQIFPNTIWEQEEIFGAVKCTLKGQLSGIASMPMKSAKSIIKTPL